jgi:hypothetical protein
MKKVVVLGASPTPWRFAYKCVRMLDDHGYNVIPIGKRKGDINDIPIITDQPQIDDVDTITLYLNPRHSDEVTSYILSLQPRRIIFNPGAENQKLEKLANANNIETINACTLVMLSTGSFEDKTENQASIEND